MASNTWLSVDLPGTQPGPSHVPSRLRHTLPSAYRLLQERRGVVGGVLDGRRRAVYARARWKAVVASRSMALWQLQPLDATHGLKRTAPPAVVRNLTLGGSAG